MAKTIRVLEVPIYLLIIAMACLELEAGGVAILLILVSIVRLFSNVITDSSIYKK